MASTACSGVKPAGSGPPAVSSTSPMRLVRSTRYSSRSRRAPSAWRAPARMVSCVRGLPTPVDGWRCSSSRPASRSSGTILETACWVSPVRSASSTRLRPPARRMCVSSRARLCSRTSRRFTPVSAMDRIFPCLANYATVLFNGGHG